MKKPLTSTVCFPPAKAANPDDIYADRDHEEQGEHFMRHLDRMTVEKLHSKSDIAGELAHRDAELEKLRQSLEWIVCFCNEHDEWFGGANSEDGAENEWLNSANKLLNNTD